MLIVTHRKEGRVSNTEWRNVTLVSLNSASVRLKSASGSLNITDLKVVSSQSFYGLTVSYIVKCHSIISCFKHAPQRIVIHLMFQSPFASHSHSSIHYWCATSLQCPRFFILIMKIQMLYCYGSLLTMGS